MEVVAKFPLFLLFPIVFLSVGIALYFYFYKRKNPETTVLPRLILAIIRSVILIILGFFLLSPYINRISFETERPMVIMGMDNSASVKLKTDSLNLFQTIHNQWKNLGQKLEQDFDVRYFAIGSKPIETSEYKHTDNLTDISGFLDEVKDRYSNRNLSGIIILSDGLYNHGVNPINKTSEISVPLFTVGIGDTIQYQDVLIKKVLHNKFGFLNNNIPFEVHIKYENVNRRNLTLEVSTNGKVINSSEVLLNSSNGLLKETVLLQAIKSGVVKYDFKISYLDQEENYKNNHFSAYVEIYEGKQKVVLISPFPHPDIRAIKSSVEQKEIYSFRSIIVDDSFNPSQIEADLLISYQMSASSFFNKSYQWIQTNKIPAWFILGSSSNIAAINKMQIGTEIKNYRKINHEIKPLINEQFDMYKFPELLTKRFNEFPPLNAPFGEYNFSEGFSPQLYQSIGNVKTNSPLHVIRLNQGLKRGITMGEGFWKWKFSEFMDYEEFSAVDLWIQKNIQVLANKEERKKFKVEYDRILNQFDNVRFNAFLYNQNFEVVTDPDIHAIIRDEKNNEYEYVFSKSGNYYYLDCGNLPVGKYLFTCSTSLSNNLLEESGAFIIEESHHEVLNLRADFGRLKKMSNISGGKFVLSENIDGLHQIFLPLVNQKPVSYTRSETVGFINIKWILFCIIFMLTLEWFARKFKGLT